MALHFLDPTTQRPCDSLGFTVTHWDSVIPKLTHLAPWPQSTQKTFFRFTVTAALLSLQTRDYLTTDYFRRERKLSHQFSASCGRGFRGDWHRQILVPTGVDRREQRTKNCKELI